MKTLAFFFVIILLKNYSFAQYDVVETINKKSKIVSKDEKYGLEYMGKLVLPLEYSDMYLLTTEKDPLIFTSKNELFGITTSTGSVILPNEYSAIDDQGNYFILVKKGKYGVLGHNRKIIIPAIYDRLEDLESYGYIVEKDGKTGAINSKGELIVPVQFNSIKVCSYDHLTFEVSTPNTKYLYIENPQYPIFKPMDGYVATSNSLFMKTTELSIADWFAFLTDYTNYDADTPIEKLLPDTTKIEKKLLPIYRVLLRELNNPEDSHVKYYTYKFTRSKNTLTQVNIKISESVYDNKQETMLDFPVTGITYEQTMKYLNWLNSKYEAELSNDMNSAVFRLPTPEEWEQAALNGLNDEMKTKQCIDSINAKGCMIFIYKDLSKCTNYDDYIKTSFGEGSVSTKILYPNLSGIYSIFGNVAEMTNRKGISKGGSFVHTAKDARTSSSIPYTNAEPWLGIRIVAEMKCF